MNKEKTDRRVRTTRRLLRDIILQQLSKKKLRDITVKELCELADINRGTFYLHYRDVYDLFEQVEEEIFQDIWKFVQTGSPLADKGNPERILPVFMDLFEYLAENRSVLIVLLGPNRDQVFFERLTNIGRADSVVFWSQRFGIADQSVTEYFYSFVVSGCVGMLQTWLENGQKESPAELAHRAQHFISRGMLALQEMGRRPFL